MTDSKLKKMSRSELLEILVQQAERIEELENELAQAKRQLERRKIDLEESGSIAEAALKLSGVFEAAQKAADIYLENVRSGDKARVKERASSGEKTEKRSKEGKSSEKK